MISFFVLSHKYGGEYYNVYIFYIYTKVNESMFLWDVHAYVEFECIC
jgi:hypothetical protein